MDRRSLHDPPSDGTNTATATAEWAGENRRQSACQMMRRSAEVLADVATSATLSQNTSSTQSGRVDMVSSKPRLPQRGGGWFLTDGGIETVRIYQDGVELPEFAAFVLLESADGRDILRRWYRRCLDITVTAAGAGFVLETPTWRAGIDWGAKPGFDAEAMQRINAEAVAPMNGLRTEYVSRITGPIVVSGCIGPRGHGYAAGARMEPEDARRAHQLQADALASAGVDQITGARPPEATDAPLGGSKRSELGVVSSWTLACGAIAYRACAPTLQRSAMPNWT